MTIILQSSEPVVQGHMLSRGQWMLIFGTMHIIVQQSMLNEKNEGAIFSGTLESFFSNICEVPLILDFSDIVWWSVFHFLNKPRHVTYQKKCNHA